MPFGYSNLQNMDYSNLSSFLGMIILLALVSLLLVYMLLNVNNKMNNFMKMYDDEQDKQEEDLEKTFEKINENNKKLQKIVNSKNVILNEDKEVFNELDSKINENENRLNEDNELINNLRDIPLKLGDSVGSGPKDFHIGHNNEMTFGADGTINLKLSDDTNFRMCDEGGNNCSQVITKRFVENRLPVQIRDGSS
jgi:hypothetical protein